MITPQQNAAAMDDLDTWYFINGHDERRDINCQTVEEQTRALIKCDRQLAQFEQHNRDMASAQRRDSIHLKVKSLWGKY